MKVLQRSIRNFVTGMGFGAIIYLLILGFAYNNVNISVSKCSVLSVLIISGLIGELTWLFKLDIPFLLAMVIHAVATVSLYILMMIINHWYINMITIMIFVLSYIVIWVIEEIIRIREVNHINIQIKKRRKNTKI
ncbi:DUF3021 family protein [Lactobacillus sp. PSON]|uniref:DUF3021 family protein n=1 Tax=Lactobacillus sp. PSON TaxID=3455454 RepID=UPI00404155B1